MIEVTVKAEQKMRKINYASVSIVRNIILALLSIVLISKSADVFAHADHDKARYVSSDGIDAGKCDNPSTPCKSVSYAGLQSNKGDRIRVAAGNYVIDDIDTLFYLCLLYTSPSPRDSDSSRMPSSA